MKRASYFGHFLKIGDKDGNATRAGHHLHPFVPLPMERKTDTCFPVVCHTQYPQNIHTYYRISNYYHMNALRCNCWYINHHFFPFSWLQLQCFSHQHHCQNTIKCLQWSCLEQNYICCIKAVIFLLTFSNLKNQVVSVGKFLLALVQSFSSVKWIPSIH